MRGWSWNRWIYNSNCFILPAHAGMILRSCEVYLVNLNITRTCGDDPLKHIKQTRVIKYYPHMRGWSSVDDMPIWTAWDITRTCGDDPPTFTEIDFSVAYYPHMWGWSHLSCIHQFRYHIEYYPHMRGWSWTINELQHDSTDITRTCGDDPRVMPFLPPKILYYPHMRGWS